MSGIVGNDGRFALGIGILQRADFVLLHIHGAEDEIDLAGDGRHIGGVAHDERTDVLRNRPIKRPAVGNGFFIRFPGAARGSGDDGDFKPRVIGQKRNKTLPHHAGGADNGNTPFTLHDESILSKISNISRKNEKKE